jgi:hypothetical protein
VGSVAAPGTFSSHMPRTPHTITSISNIRSYNGTLRYLLEHILQTRRVCIMCFRVVTVAALSVSQYRAQ